MENNEFVPEEKPQGLKVLCVLTFIYTSFFGLFSLLGLVFAKPFFRFMTDIYAQLENNPDVKEEQLQQIQKLLELGVGKFAVMCGVFLLIIGASFYGAGTLFVGGWILAAAWSEVDTAGQVRYPAINLPV